MAALDFNSTLKLVRFILKHSNEIEARTELYRLLNEIKSSEGQLCEGIVEHAKGLDLTNDEWFKLRFWRLSHQKYQKCCEYKLLQASGRILFGKGCEPRHQE